MVDLLWTHIALYSTVPIPAVGLVIFGTFHTGYSSIAADTRKEIAHSRAGTFLDPPLALPEITKGYHVLHLTARVHLVTIDKFLRNGFVLVFPGNCTPTEGSSRDNKRQY